MIISYLVLILFVIIRRGNMPVSMKKIEPVVTMAVDALHNPASIAPVLLQNISAGELGYAVFLFW